jgi:two-component system response regulator AtoC
MMPEIVRVKAVEDLGFPAEPPATPVSVKPDGAVQVDFSAGGIVLDDVERRLLWQALQAADWNRTRAAQLLGVSRDTLRYRIEKHGLRPPAGDPAG